MVIEMSVNPTRIICETRRLKSLVLFSQAEFDFIARSTDLSAEDKMTWLMLASESAAHSELSCVLSYQYLAESLGQDGITVFLTLQRLNKLGYLVVSNEEKRGVKVQLKLPSLGLLELKRTPKIRDFKDKEYIQQQRLGNNPFLPNVLETFPLVHS